MRTDANAVRLGLLLLALLLSPMRAQAQLPLLALDTGKIRGLALDGVRNFRGIPYAAAPVGDLRWRAPQPVQAWPDVRSAEHFGDACIQKPGLSATAGGDPGRLSEDCLNLNVWAPARPGRYPVMVWIHGGALVFGGGAVPLYDGAALARQGVVLVTINYRLGPLGFFAHPALDDGKGTANFGLLDQIAALKWVQRNIAAFGGDPKRVTIAGESAGAQSVLALFASPLARGLFQQGIADSPYGIPSHTRAKAQEAGRAVASALGLQGSAANARSLRAVPAERFAGISDPAANLAPGFIIGDAAFPESILTRFQNRQQMALPLLIGSNSDEATVAIAFGVDPAAVVKKMRGAKLALGVLYPGVKDEGELGRRAVTDLVFTAFSRRIAYLQSQRAPTWRYYFSYVNQGLRGKAPGVNHGGEIAYVFGTADTCACLEVPHTAPDHAMAREVQARWLAFIRNGRPDSAKAWPQDSVKQAQVLEFGERIQAQPGFMAARLNTMIALLKVADRFL